MFTCGSSPRRVDVCGGKSLKLRNVRSITRRVLVGEKCCVRQRKAVKILLHCTFIGCQARPKQVRNRNGRQKTNNGYHNHDFYERKTSLIQFNKHLYYLLLLFI